MRQGIIEIARQFMAIHSLRQRRRLILRRNIREEILIDDRVLITIEGNRGNGVAVSIRAPRDVRVMRAEVIERDVQRISESEDQAERDAMLRMVGAAVTIAGPDRS